jgi:hypothetical protein
MLKTRALVGSFVVVLAFGSVVVACGGDDGGPLQARTPGNGAAASDASAQGGASDTTAADGADNAPSDTQAQASPAGGGTPPQLAEGAWAGTLHFEVSGDVDLSADMPGGAVTQGAFSLLTFAADDGSGSSQIAFTAGSATDAAIFVSSNGFTSGGEIGKECSLSTSTNTESSVEGTFSCKGTKGVKTTSLDDFTVDIEGTFTLTRP